MKKTLLNASLWGILALSLLSSCRTEDGAITQKQIEDKRFAVFVPKSGETINYANGFEFLMKRYDEIKKTNISGINNPIKNNLKASSDKGSFLFQNKGSYVEFKVRSQIVTEQNGEKWVIYPKVENNQVIGLIMSTLKEKETLITFDEIKSDSDYYKQLLPLFQDALNRYNKKRISLALNASIKPMPIGGEGAEPGGGGTGCGDDVQKCGNIEEVIVPGKPKQPVTPPTIPIGVSSCWDIANCPTDPGSDSGGGGAPFPNPTPNALAEIDFEQLKNYPCAYALAQELPNLNNELANVLNKIFKNSDKYRITFKAGTMPDTKDGETKTLSKKEADRFFATITLNEKMLTSATKEYILITMYHEVIHAYLGYELMQLGDTKFQEKYPMYLFYNDYDSSGNVIRRFTYKQDHNEFGIFMDTLINIISSYNSSKSPSNLLSSEAIKAMAKGGVTSVSSTEYDINQREKGFDTKKYGTPNGTKCP
ncbi:hypothetical protein [Elizabethkingia anophelis]|uniref:hypothetical protein n=1 Tax=Elizabethkingia anophelis TaxID=1117645 RepID=UPI003209D8D4